MQINDESWETLDTTSHDHAGDYFAGLTTIYARFICFKAHLNFEKQFELGHWLAAHVDCPHCREHFRILNPDPTMESID